MKTEITKICRCRCCGDDYTGTGGDYLRVIGYLVAGFAGACVAALGTFLPCYAFVVIAAPAFRKYGKRPAIEAFVKGVTAAAIGAITGAVVVLGRRTLIDLPTVLLSMATLLVLWRWKKLPEPFVALGRR